MSAAHMYADNSVYWAEYVFNVYGKPMWPCWIDKSSVTLTDQKSEPTYFILCAILRLPDDRILVMYSSMFKPKHCSFRTSIRQWSD